MKLITRGGSIQNATTPITPLMTLRRLSLLERAILLWEFNLRLVILQDLRSVQRSSWLSFRQLSS